METHPPVMKQVNSVFNLNPTIPVMQDNQAGFSVVHESKYLVGNAMASNGPARVLTDEVVQLITPSIVPADAISAAPRYEKGKSWS